MSGTKGKSGVYIRTEYHKQKMREVSNKGKFKKGHPPTKGCFKKGNKPTAPFKKGHKFTPRGKNHWNWKNGQSKHTDGYILILKPNHPRANNRGYVKRAILIMEKIISRFLNSKEIVHHKGTKYPMGSFEDKQDDRPENLRLFPNQSKHHIFHNKN